MEDSTTDSPSTPPATGQQAQEPSQSSDSETGAPSEGFLSSNPLPLHLLMENNPSPVRVKIEDAKNLPDWGEAFDHWAVRVITESVSYAGLVVLPTDSEQVPGKGELWEIVKDKEPEIGYVLRFVA